MGTLTRRAGAALGLMALVALAGCDEIGHARLDYSATEKVAVTDIVIEDGGSGDITVRGDGADGEVRIDRVVNYRGGQEPGRTYELTGTTLHIDTDCGRWCSVDYEIVAPPGVKVRGRNGSGDISITDAAELDVTLGSGNIVVSDSAGPVALETGSGNIEVRAVEGDLTLRTGSGNVLARGVSGATTRVHTGSGDVDLELAKPGNVDAEASSGNVVLRVPAAGSYRVQATPDSGDASVTVAHDPTGDFSLRLSTGSGDITVDAI